MGKVTFYNVIKFLFFACFVLLPFTDFEGIQVLGEHKKDLAAHVLLLGVFIYYAQLFFKGKVINIKSICYLLFILFYMWCIVSYFSNFSAIGNSWFKGQGGHVRFFKQMIVLSMSLFGFVPFFYYVIRKIGVVEIFFKLRSLLSVMLFVTFLFCMLEVAVGWYHVKFLSPIYDFITMIINKEETVTGVWAKNRISGFTYEPPFLAMYLIAVFPFVLTYLYDNIKKSYYILFVLILVYLCGSRTALIICLVQLLVFLMLLLRYVLNYKSKYKFIERLIVTVIIAMPFVGGIVIDKTQHVINSLVIEGTNKGGSNVSNVTRMSTQLTAFEVFKQNPITGVGIGQQSYYLVKMYPDWAVKLSYELRLIYINDKDPTWPPGYSLFTRLLAETGIVGFGLFFSAVLLLIYITFQKMVKSNQSIIFAVVFTLFVGGILNAMQFDSFRSIPFWFTVGFAIVAIQQGTKDDNVNVID